MPHCPGSMKMSSSKRRRRRSSKRRCKYGKLKRKTKGRVCKKRRRRSRRRSSRRRKRRCKYGKLRSKTKGRVCKKRKRSREKRRRFTKRRRSQARSNFKRLGKKAMTKAASRKRAIKNWQKLGGMVHSFDN